MITTLTRNFNGVQNLVQLNCDNTFTEITTSGFLTTTAILDSINQINNGAFDFLPNDQILVTYANGHGFFNYDGTENRLTPSALSYDTFSYAPVVTFTNPGDLSVSYSLRSGIYYYNGRILHCNIDLTFTPTYTTATGEISISLPQSGVRLTGGFIDYGSNLTLPSGITQVVPLLNIGDNHLYIKGLGSASEHIMTTTQYPSAGARHIEAGFSFIVD